MRVIDAFLVKYEAKGGQVSLPLHSDQVRLRVRVRIRART